MVSKPPQNECVRKYNYLGTVINENNDIGTCHTHFCCIITSLIAICIVDLKSSDLHATYSTWIGHTCMVAIILTSSTYFFLDIIYPALLWPTSTSRCFSGSPKYNPNSPFFTVLSWNSATRVCNSGLSSNFLISHSIFKGNPQQSIFHSSPSCP